MSTSKPRGTITDEYGQEVCGCSICTMQDGLPEPADMDYYRAKGAVIQAAMAAERELEGIGHGA